MRWLDERQPKSGAVALIHNDFKLDNIVLSPDDPSRILGVLDWEMSTIGDPMVDLGCSMAYWVESSDPAPLLQTRTLPSTEPGMPSRRQLLRMYEAHTGRPLGDFRWYRVFGLFRLAVIAQQIYLRYTLGQTRDPRFAGLGAAVGALVGQAEVALQEYAG